MTLPQSSKRGELQPAFLTDIPNASQVQSAALEHLGRISCVSHTHLGARAAAGVT